MDAHQKLLNRIAGKPRRGEFVRTTDGRVLFLTQKQLSRATLTKEQRAKVGTIWTTKRRMSPGCRGVMKWLLANDPFTQFWRETYVEWVNHC